MLAPAIALGACAAMPVRDGLPPAIPRATLSSSIYLGVAEDLGDGNELVRWGSGVVVGPRRVLTAKHVWVDFPAPPGPPPRTRRVDVYVSAWRWPRSLELGIVAEGSDDPFLGDWVLLETETPCWGPDQIACIHAPAANAGWTLPRDTTIWMAGYGGLFRAPAGSHRSFLRRGPYVIAGAGAPASSGVWMEYDQGWPAPEGASGGGMYLWSEARARMELVGLFVECRSWPFGVLRWLRGVPIGLISAATEL